MQRIDSIQHTGYGTTRRALALCALLALAGCSAPDDPDGGKTEATPQSAALDTGSLHDGQLSYPPEDFHEQTPGKPGGTLRATAALDTYSFDIHALSHGNVQWLGRILYDCLVYQDEQGNISPWLARSWEISPDGLTYTFHLRDDVSFSDGTRFDAEAVRVNLEHMRDPATKSPLAAAYIAPYLSGKVLDEYTFQATLREPYSPFLDVLAQSWLGMISPKQILQDPKSIAEHPVGSGPFVLERYTQDQSASFVRRAGYHWAPPVLRHQGPAYLERLELSFVPEALIRYSSLVSGQYDLTLDAPTQNAQAIRKDPSLVLRSRIRKGNPVRSLTFNVERFPFDDVRVRKALAKAIDRDGLAWITGFGEYQVKSDFLAANSRFYDPAFRDALKYDVDAANQLLDEAGWTAHDSEGYRLREGRRLAATLLMVDSPALPASVAVAMQADAKKVGIELGLRVLPQAQVNDLRYAGDYQALVGGYWHTNTPDGLYILYHSNSIATPKLIGQNSARLRDAQLDELLGRARRSTDTAEQQRLYSAAQQRLTELVPAVPVYESQLTIAYRRNVKGVVFDSSHNVPFFTSIWLDQEQP